MSDVTCRGVPCFIDGCPQHWPKESFDFDQTLSHIARVPLGDKLFNQMCQQASDKCGVGEKNGAYKSGFEDCWSIVKPDIIDQLQAECERKDKVIAELTCEVTHQQTMREDAKDYANSLEPKIKDIEIELIKKDAQLAKYKAALERIANMTDSAIYGKWVTVFEVRDDARAALAEGDGSDDGK